MGPARAATRAKAEMSADAAKRRHTKLGRASCRTTSGASTTSASGSVSGIFAGLSRSIGSLVRAEINLATVVMAGKATEVGKDVGGLAVGGAIAYAGFFVLLASMVRILESFLPRWLAALVVGGITTGGGAFLVQKELRALKEADLAPRQAMGALKKLGE